MHSVWILKISLQLAHIGYVIVASAFSLRPDPLVGIQPLWVSLLVPVPVASNIWHYLLLKRASANVAEPANLVTSRGLFRFARHPMYLGDTLVVVFLSLAWLNWVTSVIAILAIVAILRLASVEDRDLRKHFGAAHRDWFAKTNLIFPARIGLGARRG